MTKNNVVKNKILSKAIIFINISLLKINLKKEAIICSDIISRSIAINLYE